MEKLEGGKLGGCGSGEVGILANGKIRGGLVECWKCGEMGG